MVNSTIDLQLIEAYIQQALNEYECKVKLKYDQSSLSVVMNLTKVIGNQKQSINTTITNQMQTISTTITKQSINEISSPVTLFLMHAHIALKEAGWEPVPPLHGIPAGDHITDGTTGPWLGIDKGAHTWTVSAAPDLAAGIELPVINKSKPKPDSTWMPNSMDELDAGPPKGYQKEKKYLKKALYPAPVKAKSEAFLKVEALMKEKHANPTEWTESQKKLLEELKWVAATDLDFPSK